MPVFSPFPFLSPLPPALHAQLETQVDFLAQLSRHAFEALGQLGELNIRAAGQLTDDGIRLGRALAACNDPLQAGTVVMREAQPAFEHWRDWQTQLIGIISSGNPRFARDADGGSRQGIDTAYTGAHRSA